MAKKQERALLLVEVDENSYEFEYTRIPFEVNEQFYEITEKMHAEGQAAEAEKHLTRLTRDYPEFIDAHHHRALLLAWRGESEKALLAWQQAVQTGLDALPDLFVFGRDRLEWGWLDNRPFLRAYHSLALHLEGLGMEGEALARYRDLLDLNPNDNQGVRELAIGLLFRMRRPLDVLEICDQYPDDWNEGVLYGRVLALLWLGRRDEARDALARAYKSLPLVARELAKRTHKQPAGRLDGYVTVGGADQAYAYWENYGDLWKKVRGATAFIQSFLRDDKA